MRQPSEVAFAGATCSCMLLDNMAGREEDRGVKRQRWDASKANRKRWIDGSHNENETLNGKVTKKLNGERAGSASYL